MKEGVDYLLRRHPEPRFENHNVIILRNEPYDGVVVEYSDVVIGAVEEGRTDRELTFNYRVVHQPRSAPYLETDEFEEYVNEVVRDVIEDHHDRRANIYVSTETGENVDY